MRIFKKVAYILFVICCVLSVTIAVCLSVSSTNKLLFKDNVDARLKIYSTAYNNLSNSKKYTIVSENKYGTDQRVKEEISCEVKQETEGTSFDCKMISKLYNSDGGLVKTSYFPGDGYKYTEENETKVQTTFSNSSLAAYFSSMIVGAMQGLNYIIYDYNNPDEKEHADIDTEVEFNFNQFALLKTIGFNYQKDSTKLTASFKFDKKDRLTEYNYNQMSSMKISYSLKELQIPSLTGFQKA